MTFTALLFSCGLLGVVSGLCCPWHPTSDVKCACDDGGLVHPWECCATGACNVFCCNCAGECRKNTTLPLEADEGGAKDSDSAVDWSFLLTADSMLPQVQVLGRRRREVSGLAGTKLKFMVLDHDKSNSLDVYEIARMFGDDS